MNIMNIYQKFLFLLGFESNADNTRFEKHGIAVTFNDNHYIIETNNFTSEPAIVNCEDYNRYDNSMCEGTAFESFVSNILYHIASAYDLKDAYDDYSYCSKEGIMPMIALMLHEIGYRPEQIALEMYGKGAIFDLVAYKEISFISEEKQYERELVGETYWHIYKDRKYTDCYYRINKSNERIEMSSHDWVIDMLESLKK